MWGCEPSTALVLVAGMVPAGQLLSRSRRLAETGVTHLIDEAQAHIQGSLWGGILLLTPAQAPAVFKHSKVRQKQSEGDGRRWPQGENGGREGGLSLLKNREPVDDAFSLGH